MALSLFLLTFWILYIVICESILLIQDTKLKEFKKTEFDEIERILFKMDEK